MKKLFNLLCVCLLVVGICGCSCKDKSVPTAKDGSFDTVNQSFGVDENVNVNTIDEYLNLDNVV